MSHHAHRSVIKKIKREVAHVWHCCSSFCSSRPAPDFWSLLAIRHPTLMNETENVCGLPPCSKVLALPITNCKDLTHLCNCLLVCMCVYVRVRGCVLFAHTRGSGLYVFFFVFFFHRVQLLGNCLYALEFPSADGNGSVQPTHPTSPLSSRITTLLFLSPASQLLSPTCILLIPQILVSPVDASCRRCTCVVA